eukprot:CAMPEP_0113845280 /NCGR_PEP_ID=MMETSP0372-20130328/668_1 /TAXON_ID=340204 /ORGANISM="Lankesteria abbotti" /LENGTH=312 /DNA_ID=CAMNT_0000814303 /DNA_START=209 /DNA_END=1148 /DNA_ORIENTATION=- /assembly_acc=CAM_ASM_000359
MDELTVPLSGGERREVLLGVSDVRNFKKQTCYMGASVGRFANRIKHGQFEIAGEKYQVTRNIQNHCLHGGNVGFDKKRWKVVYVDKQHALFELFSADGEEGFPGNLTVTAMYCLTDNNEVKITYKAKTDKTTPVNLANHAYFNLTGGESGTDSREQQLQVHADQYLPLNKELIALDSPKTVSGTSFDFRKMKKIKEHFLSDDQQKAASGYDHSFFFDDKRNLSVPVAELISGDGKLQMSLITTKPALQLYTGNWLDGNPNRSGNALANFAGVALEPQFLPDSPNHPEWQQVSCFLNPSETYEHTTTYRFVPL